MANPKSVLESYKKEINRSLEVFFNLQIAKSNKKAAFFKNSLKSLREYHLRKGGKRIRALLVMLGYTLFKNKRTAGMAKVARAMELIHSSLLIKDDIMDEDILRRGKPALHYFFEKLHQKKYKIGDSKHFGISLGILSGDISSIYAYGSIIDSSFPNQYKIRALERFNQMYFDTVYGQMIDVLNSYRKKVALKDILEVYRYKTAKYTIECPLHLGALLSGAGKRELNLLSSYAIPLGIAFQIKDDILGMFGDKKTVGKPATSDLEEGKQTFVMFFAFKKANQSQRKFLLKCFGQKNIKIGDLKKVRLIIAETGALQYCQEYANLLVRKAKKALSVFKGVNKNTLFLLNYIADYIIKRDY
jgi:geranylgeranyl diphosphate synthase type I